MTFNPGMPALAALVMLAGTAVASASPFAAAATNVNVRSGPGAGHGVVAVLPRGEVIEVDGCRGEWCLVVYGGGWTGWVGAGFLDFRREARPEPRPSQPWGQEYPVRYENAWEIRQYYDLPPVVNQQVGGMYPMVPVGSGYDAGPGPGDVRVNPGWQPPPPSQGSATHGGASAW